MFWPFLHILYYRTIPLLNTPHVFARLQNEEKSVFAQPSLRTLRETCPFLVTSLEEYPTNRNPIIP